MSLFRSKNDPEGNGRRPGGDGGANPGRPVSEVAGESDALAQRLQRRLADLESHPHVFEPTAGPRRAEGSGAEGAPAGGRTTGGRATDADIADLNDQLDLLRHQLEEAFAEFEQRIEAAERRAAAAEEAAATAEARAVDQADVTSARVRELSVTAERVSSQLAALTTEIGGDDMSDLRQALDRLKANRAQAANNAAALRQAKPAPTRGAEASATATQPTAPRAGTGRAAPPSAGGAESAPQAKPAPARSTSMPGSGGSAATPPALTIAAPTASSALVQPGAQSTGIAAAPPAKSTPALPDPRPATSVFVDAAPSSSPASEPSRPPAKSTVLSWPGGREAPPLDERSSGRGRGRRAEVDPDPDRL